MGADAAPTPRQWQDHSHRALRAGLAHIRKESSYMGACVAPMPPRKRRAFNPKVCPHGYKICGDDFRKQRKNAFMWGLMPPPRPGSGRATPIVRSAQDLCTFAKGRCIWGLAPPPCPHVNAGRLIPNSALTGIKSAEMILENSAEVFGCGGFVLWGYSPHAPGNMGCCIPNCALRRRKKAIKKKTQQRIFKRNACFPFHNCIGIARSAQWEWPCHCRGVGAASAPTSKNLCAGSPNFPSSFSAFFAPFLCP